MTNGKVVPALQVEGVVGQVEGGVIIISKLASRDDARGRCRVHVRVQ